MSFFIHMGYPKAFSTSLQRQYFAQHPEIFYGGVGIDSNIDYINKGISLLMESGLIYFNRALFDTVSDNFLKVVLDFRESADRARRMCMGLSSEHLIFSFSLQCIDYREKVDRVVKLFGSIIKIILILRRQTDLIRSLYKEYVRYGYTESYEHFISWIYQYQDKNFYSQLLYGEVIDYPISVFSRENIFLDWFHRYTESDGEGLDSLTQGINTFLGIPTLAKAYKTMNTSIPDNFIESVVLNNRVNRHDFGESHLEGFENHRREAFFNSFLNLGLSEAELFENVICKRQNIAGANSTNSGNDIFSIEDTTTYNAIVHSFNMTNEKLTELMTCS